LDQYNFNEGIGSSGWWTALSAKLPASVSAATGFGGEYIDDDTKKKVNPETQGNMFVFANVGYNFTSAAKLTLEWLTFSTDYKDAWDKSLNRYEMNFRYDFK
jgi:hypothetical protein